MTSTRVIRSRRVAELRYGLMPRPPLKYEVSFQLQEAMGDISKPTQARLILRPEANIKHVQRSLLPMTPLNANVLARLILQPKQIPRKWVRLLEDNARIIFCGTTYVINVNHRHVSYRPPSRVEILEYVSALRMRNGQPYCIWLHVTRILGPKDFIAAI